MKKNSLTTAVLAGLTGVIGMAGVANAVNVNPDGLGQVLLFPYYTARADENGKNSTLISIVNTTADAKAVKVRFIEGINSREVLDFNLYLSPFDVWTAAVTELPSGVPGIMTNDTSCTVPYIFGDRNGMQEFLDFQYVPPRSDRGPQGIERAASGYIEIIEMGSIVNDGAGAQWFQAIKHQNGVPASGGPLGAPCSRLVNAWRPGGAWTTNSGLGISPATGGLFGGGAIVNVQEGTMFSYNAIALDDFWAEGEASHTDPGNLLPSLASSNNTRSNIFSGGRLISHIWDDSVLAINAVLTYEFLFNEYSSVPGFSNTEWVLTFPTKRFHVDAGNPGGPVANPDIPLRPFTNRWSLVPGGVLFPCEDFGFRFWDREETEIIGDVDVSPRPPRDGFQLCQETNVIRIGGSPGAVAEITKEPARGGGLGFVNLNPRSFTEGWVEFDLATNASGPPARRSSALGTIPAGLPGAGTQQRVEGLPVVGFSLTTFRNEVDLPVLSNYGQLFNHRGSRSIVGS